MIFSGIVAPDCDELLTLIFGKVGTDEARVRLRCRIIEHIIATYPELAAVGDEQIRRSEGSAKKSAHPKFFSAPALPDESSVPRFASFAELIGQKYS